MQESDSILQLPLPDDEEERDTLELLVIGCVNRANESPSGSLVEALNKAASHGFSRTGRPDEPQATAIAAVFIKAAEGVSASL
jgi:hypothetical protein